MSAQKLQATCGPHSSVPLSPVSIMFGGGGESSSNAARRTIVFGVCIGLSFILLLVAGLVTKNWLGCVGISHAYHQLLQDAFAMTFAG